MLSTVVNISCKHWLPLGFSSVQRTPQSCLRKGSKFVFLNAVTFVRPIYMVRLFTQAVRPGFRLRLSCFSLFLFLGQSQIAVWSLEGMRHFSPVPELSFLPASYRGRTRAGERLTAVKRKSMHNALVPGRRPRKISISFPEPTCLLVSTKTRSSGIIN